VVNGRSHYDVLSVSPDASAEMIRESYRRLAREFHPDRTAGSAAGGDKMPLINEAYRVLSDPGRRAVYDAERRGTPVRTDGGVHTESRHVADDVPTYQYQHLDGPARVPWRSLLFFSGLAITVILVLAQFEKSSEPSPPDNLLRVGECVELQRSGTAANEVVCSGSGDLVVRLVVTRQAVCPDGSVSTPDRQGMVGVCLEQLPPSPDG
jgi:molecular chaperone DnaJ